mmetsp:Transcript_16441/g.53606  ORF Transcript_16441/g.53606 Transcript_16441/m.53606 type:complete len:313 (-) Transcript_16441:805-1743(-)
MRSPDLPFTSGAMYRGVPTSAVCSSAPSPCKLDTLQPASPPSALPPLHAPLKPASLVFPAAPASPPAPPSRRHQGPAGRLSHATASPKSASLAWLCSSRRMLDGLTSRCIRLLRCTYANPSATSHPMREASRVRMGMPARRADRSRLAREPCGMYSSTRPTPCGIATVPKQPQMQGWRRRVSTAASRSSASDRHADELETRTILTATTEPSQLPQKTAPMPPLPMSGPSSKSQAQMAIGSGRGGCRTLPAGRGGGGSGGIGGKTGGASAGLLRVGGGSHFSTSRSTTHETAAQSNDQSWCVEGAASGGGAGA